MSRKLADRSGARQQGWVYTLHLVPAYEHAAHYTGWALNLEARLAEHQAGVRAASRLMQVQHDRGGGFILAAVRRGTRDDEITLKTRGAARRCPVCRGVMNMTDITVPLTEAQAEWLQGITADGSETMAEALEAGARIDGLLLVIPEAATEPLGTAVGIRADIAGEGNYPIGERSTVLGLARKLVKAGVTGTAPWVITE